VSEPLPSPKEAIEKLLASMAAFEASDLHLKVGYPPYYRVRGALRGARMARLPDAAFIEAMLADMLPAGFRETFDARGAIDFSVRGSTGDRYRINMFRAMGEPHASIRRVQSRIPSFDELNLPPVYGKTVGRCNEGLVLVSGASGSGKSTTLAAMVDHVNQTRSVHIITIEDPIEFTFTPRKAVISQREIGIDVPNYTEALRDAVRQDPDCILIGEMRDRETMLAGIQAAETGHLVFGSVHIADVQQTFSRILEFFPRAEHPFVRSSLANSLRGIFCQKLLPGIDEGTVYPATEVLLMNSTVKDKIVQEKDDELTAMLTKYRHEDMRSFTASLCELVQAEMVHFDTALEHAPNRDALTSAVKGILAE
jgi:twitching motility protein PilT